MVQTLAQLSVHLSRFREAAAVTAQDNCKQKLMKKKLMHVAKCLQASLRAGRQKSAKQCARLKSKADEAEARGTELEQQLAITMAEREQIMKQHKKETALQKVHTGSKMHCLAGPP